MRKGINISHVNIENMGSRDQSQVKIKFKKFKKVKSVPKTYQKVITMTPTNVCVPVLLSTVNVQSAVGAYADI